MNATAALISIQTFRFDPQRPAEIGLKTYHVPTEKPLSVMTLLARIHETNLAFACRTST